MVVTRVLSDAHADDNPYAERGFKRGNDIKPKIRKFLCYFNLSLGLLFSAVYDLIQLMVWFTLTLLRAHKYQVPFYMAYMAISAERVYRFYKFVDGDSEPIREKMFRAHKRDMIALGVI